MRDEAIFNTHSNVCSVANDKIGFDIEGNVVVLDQSAITTEFDRLTAVYNAQAYARARKAKYDALNQLELISDDSANNTTTHVDAIAAIKLKYPKS